MNQHQEFLRRLGQYLPTRRGMHVQKSYEVADGLIIVFDQGLGAKLYFDDQLWRVADGFYSDDTHPGSLQCTGFGVVVLPSVTTLKDAMSWVSQCLESVSEEGSRMYEPSLVDFGS